MQHNILLCIINPRRVCARVTVLGLSVCLSVCLSVLFLGDGKLIHVKVPNGSGRHSAEFDKN